jgi:hypothetical protein
MPTLPGSRIQLRLRRLQNSIRIIEPPTVRVTHLAKKALPMRHKISPHHRNPLKTRSLKPDEFNFTPPVRCVTRMVPEVAAVPPCNRCFHPGKLRVLIVTGRNIHAHDWRVDTPVPGKLLEDTGKRKPFLNGPIHS